MNCLRAPVDCVHGAAPPYPRCKSAHRKVRGCHEVSHYCNYLLLADVLDPPPSAEEAAALVAALALPCVSPGVASRLESFARRLLNGVKISLP